MVFCSPVKRPMQRYDDHTGDDVHDAIVGRLLHDLAPVHEQDAVGHAAHGPRATELPERQRVSGGGRIVNISSIHEFAPRAGGVDYDAAKGGLAQLTRTLALELAPDIRVIAPWREWELTSRTALIEFAEQHQIPVPKDKRGESPFSTDANLLHTSSEGKVLEDPWEEVPDYVYSRTDDPLTAPDTPEEIDPQSAPPDDPCPDPDFPRETPDGCQASDLPDVADYLKDDVAKDQLEAWIRG